ncbi:hypothetical protein CYMTET_42454 [Cymbomonas tetramitiformis]|uniref:Uncharacterized protein n=1 Tax=Cymbomonas tetramitiformis TaxID=36881 RepID=A0AAE0F2M1_9CHLO|nr:hypothetical protein CYMTET_42454 [Cymbomonas tetramitiformis]
MLATPEVEDPGEIKANDAAATEFSTLGLDLTSFDFNDLTKEVIPLVNKLVYDTFSELMEADSDAERHFLATDCSTNRGGRRALIDLVKGCILAAVRVLHQEGYLALRYPARVDPRHILAKEHCLVLENKAVEWNSTEVTR